MDRMGWDGRLDDWMRNARIAIYSFRTFGTMVHEFAHRKIGASMFETLK